MLLALSIRDIVLIDKLDLGFDGGLTVFTGETGAGKSIIIDSLGLALGGRGDASLVRRGVACGSVTASFDGIASGSIFDLLRDRDLDDGDTLVMRRVQFADGRTKAFVNDRPVSTNFLREAGAVLVEIHGQHADRAMLDPSSHRDLLDAFGGLGPEVSQTSSAWRFWLDLSKKAACLAEAREAAFSQAEYLKAATDELNALAPKDNEEEELARNRQALQTAARLHEDLADAVAILSPPAFPAAKLSAIMRRFERQLEVPPRVQAAMDGLERALIEAEEARSLFEQELRNQETGDVEAVEERLFKLRAAARKYRVPVGGLAALHGRMLLELAAIETGEADLTAARKAANAAHHRYSNAADALSEKRRAAASKLDKAVQKELKPLRLEKAQFITHTDPIMDAQSEISGGPFGHETVTFFVQTNPGSKPGPMMKVASGGELARFLLALKVVLASKTTVPVLVFDEIDTGVGGATAAAIGGRLARLGERAQVIAVTHSPQVAAHADAHYRLYKTASGNGENVSVETRAEALDSDGRCEEIARMLAGKTVTAEARAAAGRLMGAKHEIAS